MFLFSRRFLRTLCTSLFLIGILAMPSEAVDAAPRHADRHYCEASNGVVIVQRGSARCRADGTSYAKATGLQAEAIAQDGGHAIAEGDGSYAQAGGTGSPGGKATATGKGSYATADSGGTAHARGDGSYASAHVGVATANGTNSRAQAVDGGSIADAYGTNSHAVAIGGGRAIADGVGSFAEGGGAGSTARAIGDGSYADVAGLNSTATASGGGRATATGDYSSATANGACEVHALAGQTLACTAP